MGARGFGQPALQCCRSSTHSLSGELKSAPRHTCHYPWWTNHNPGISNTLWPPLRLTLHLYQTSLEAPGLRYSPGPLRLTSFMPSKAALCEKLLTPCLLWLSHCDVALATLCYSLCVLTLRRYFPIVLMKHRSFTSVCSSLVNHSWFFGHSWTRNYRFLV